MSTSTLQRPTATIPAFDTIASANFLREQGWTKKQAESMVHVVSQAVNHRTATKADLLEVKQRLQKDIYKLAIMVESSKTDLICWMVGIAFAQMAMTTALIKFVN